MSKAERGPQEYKNRHSKSIHLNTYRGVASDLMELNAPVADGFMRVSDMRSEVVIVQKPQERVRDYEQVGYVRVAKFLQLPRIDFWKRNNLIQTKKEDDIWYIAINDQDLADKVVRGEDNGKKFDDRFVESFKAEVNRGLVDCLKREKLLNSGRYNLAFLAGYLMTLINDVLAYPALTVGGVIGGSNPAEVVATTTVLLATAHVAFNTLFLVGSRFDYIDGSVFPKFNDPIVKHSLLELLMPNVPIDRLLRGLYYLNKNGGNLINSSK